MTSNWGWCRRQFALTWLDGADTVMIAQRESRQPVRAVYRPGERRAALDTAAGLVLLAGLPPRTIELHLPRQVLEVTSLLSCIQQIGWTQTSHGDTVELAAPVCVDGVQPVAALLINLPSFRATPEWVAELEYPLRQAAARLSYRMGAPVYQPYGWVSSEPLGPKTPLDETEVEQFLQGPWSARLACVRRDGAPHVIPLWYEWANRCMWVTASPDAYWKNLCGRGPASVAQRR